MTGRERILAALHRQPVDRVPWSPLIDYYFLQSLPLGVAEDKYELCRLIGADIFDWHPQGRALSWPHCQTETCQVGHRPDHFSDPGQGIFTTIHTPKGTLTERRVVTPTTTFIAEPKIKTAADLLPYRAWIEDTHMETDDSVAAAQARCGEDGLAVVCGPQSPAQLLIGEEAGLENFYFLLADHERELYDLLEAMHEINKQAYRLLADAPTVAILAPEDVSTSTMSPAICGRFTFRYLDDYADIAHAAGKLLLGHMCGRLEGMAGLIAASRLDGIESVTPPTIGDMPIDRARALWPDKILIGGLEPAKLAMMSEASVRQYVRETLQAAGDGKGFTLATGDTTPHGTPLANLRAVSETVRDYRGC